MSLLAAPLPLRASLHSTCPERLGVWMLATARYILLWLGSYKTLHGEHIARHKKDLL